uniref:Uncharacterized protein n=1 Tax=Panagrolaimus superbus TaxID=310955 RepID=A0A914YFJ1_9BILA
MVSYFKDAIKCVRIVVNRYAKSNIVELDIGIISALVLINQILKIESNNVEAQQFKANLINEYHSYLANRFGTELGIQRFTETLFMMNDTAELCHEIREGLTIFSVFSSEDNTEILSIYSSKSKLLNKRN